jgi:hypothetical protein
MFYANAAVIFALMKLELGGIWDKAESKVRRGVTIWSDFARWSLED